MKPAISVVIPFYREGKLLENALDSVLQQTFQDFEIILVNNNATGETLQIAQAFNASQPNRIHLFHEPDQGACSARNTGIRNSRGTFIALFDGDDRMKPERLDRQIQILQDNPDVSLVSCHHDLITFDGVEVIQRNIPELSYSSKSTLELKKILKDLFEPFGFPYIDSFDLFSASFLLFRRDDALKAGLFDSRLNPRGKDDWEFVMRMFELGRFVLIPEALQYFRDENPQTRKFKLKAKHEKRVLLHEQKFIGILWERYGQTIPQNKASFKKLVCYTLNRFGCYLMGFKEGKKLGKNFLKRALILDPSDVAFWKNYTKTWAPSSFHPHFFDFEEEQDQTLDFEPDFSCTYLKWPPTIPSGKTIAD